MTGLASLGTQIEMPSVFRGESDITPPLVNRLGTRTVAGPAAIDSNEGARSAMRLVSPLVSSVPRRLVAAAALCLPLFAAPTLSLAQEGEAPPAPYDLGALDCGELDKESGLRPLRPSHTAGDDLDILCKVTVSLSDKSPGSPKSHSVKLTVLQSGKTTFEQARDARVLTPGKRVVLFVVPAEKLPTEAGKVLIRAELSKPANKPGMKEVSFDLVAED